VSVKLCECGCGQPAPVAKRDNKRRGYVKGQPIPHIYGHHVQKGKAHPNWRGGKTNDTRNGHPMTLMRDHPRARSNGYVPDHILAAERVLGKPLPSQAVVHHHTPEQLVICQNQGYHRLLHMRQEALKACDHAHWRKCALCGKWDSPEDLYIPPKKGSAKHRSCHAKREKQRKKGPNT